MAFAIRIKVVVTRALAIRCDTLVNDCILASTSMAWIGVGGVKRIWLFCVISALYLRSEICGSTCFFFLRSKDCTVT